MTDHQDHDTEAAPTEQASPPTTELPPASHAAASPEAWSLDDTAEVDSAPPRRRFVWAGLVTLVVAIAGALIFLAATFFGSGPSKHVEPESKPSITVPVAPPPGVIVTAAPLAPPVVIPGLSVYDQNFLSLMSQEGWGCTDNSGAEQCRKQMVSFAHQICSYSGQPIDLIYQNFGLPSFLGPREERRAIANAEQAYPNCTFTGSP
jgi:hypothetical protein